ncbi:hypothetical protein WMY93_027265, partial [Mugilogobius chulae]
GPQLKVVERTRTATLLCAASGTPDPEIQWFKDFLPVNISSSNGRVKQLRSGGTPIRGALQIENSEESDQGKYECVATNRAGTRYSAPANLYVRDQREVRRVPPRFSIPPSNHEVMPGGSLNLTCVAVGAPMPSVKWVSEQTELTQQAEIGRNVLVLTSIQQSNNYTCVATSALGSIHTTAQVSVKALPQAPTGLTVTETTATSVTLSWDSGNPDPVLYYVIQYQARGSVQGFQEVDGVASTRYSIGGLSPFSEYDFQVLAVNNVGRGLPGATISTRTSEQAPSSPPLHLLARMLSTKEPNGQIQGYRVLFSPDEDSPLGAWQSLTTDAQLQTTLSGLTPELTYTIRVLAFTAMGDGPLSDALRIKAQQGVPSPPADFQGEAELDSQVLLSWLWPVQDEVISYELQYWEASAPARKPGAAAAEQPQLRSAYRFSLSLPLSSSENVIVFPTTSSGENVTSHAPPEATHNKQYGVRIRQTISCCTLLGFKRLGYIVKITVRSRLFSFMFRSLTRCCRHVRYSSDCACSSSQKVEVYPLNSTALRVMWKPPIRLKHHGPIRGYQVLYAKLENNEPTGQAVILDVSEPEAQDTIITGLQPETTYSVTVTAHNTQGQGAPSTARQATTTGAVMQRPTMMISTTNSNTALIQWQPSQKMVGEHRGYRLQYKSHEEDTFILRDFRPTDDHFTITRLHKGTTYTFNSAPSTKLVVGRNIHLSQNLTVVGLSSTSIDLFWEPPPLAQRNGRIVQYVVVSRNINSQNNSSHSTSSTHLSLESLQPDTTYDIRVQAFTSRGGGPLSPSIQSRTLTTAAPAFIQNFAVKMVAMTSVLLSWDVPDTYSSHEPLKSLTASPFSELLTLKELQGEVTVSPDEVHLLWVMGPVLSVILIILTVIVILVFKSRQERKRTCSSVKDQPLSHRTQPVLSPCSDPVDMWRLQHLTAGLQEHPPVPLSDLAKRIQQLKTNDNLQFYQEYESIDPGQQFTWLHSNLEVNRPKNRYANVISYDHSRVVLSKVDGVVGSDYINANYIDGYRKQRAYIATQGPLPETLGDFWRMVWEQNVCTIVMMTRLEEESRIKCDQYWPSRGTETYDMIRVSVVDTIELATYSLRTFILHKYPTQTLSFLRRIRAWRSPHAGPMVVHCSAGVGRTGCFIAIDAMLERMKHQHSIDIYGHVTCMRAQRNYMVQTEEQYMFIYDALLEAATCGHTEVPAHCLHTHVTQLSQPAAGYTCSTLQLEFKKLSSSIVTPPTMISGSLPCNKSKNRLETILPFEPNRVSLQLLKGIQGSDYINASFIHGYRQQRAYIAAQGPLPGTTDDFWRMLWEHNSTIVVMLTKLREIGREKCHQYWPTNSSSRSLYFVLEPVAEYKMPEYIMQEFKVTDTRNGQSRTIRQFHFIDWPEQGVPQTAENFIDFIGQVHKTKDQFGQDGPITVHCSTGAGRTGVFIALSIILEQLRCEGIVDVFQTVKLLRTQRTAMVQTEEQYRFCYRAALEYVGLCEDCLT